MVWYSKVRTGIGGPVLLGIAVLVAGFGGFGSWAALAPLQGAVIANAEVVAQGRNKVVQHLEGGIVREIPVEEGDRVAAGDPVLILDPTAADAARNRLLAQLDVLAAIEARALAERDGADRVAFPEDLLRKRDEPDVGRILDDQQAEFVARRDKHRAEIAILNQQIAAHREEIVGLESQLEANDIQLELIKEEKADSESLLEKGLTKKTRVLELRRSEAGLIGRQGQFTAEIAKARQTIAESQHEIERLKVERLEEAVTKLGEVRLERADLIEQLRTAQDVLDRIVVRAPVSGTIIELTKYNPGAVLRPGETVMEIVPEGSDLLIEAKVRPRDIDEVHIEQDAWLSFQALDARTVPPVPGVVKHVSADALTDEDTGESYYLVRLRMAGDPPSGFDPAAIGPGQPVEVFITTAERTFFAYLVEPLTKTIRRAFRET